VKPSVFLRNRSSRGVAVATVAIVTVVAAAAIWAIFLRPGGAATSGNGASPTPRVTCSDVSAASCEKVQAEVVRFIGQGRQALTVDISTSSICLGDPFDPISCPLDPAYFASGVAQLADGEWAFLNVFSAANGQLRSNGRILAAPPGWTP